MVSNEYKHGLLDAIHNATYDFCNSTHWCTHPQGEDIMDKLEEVMQLLNEVNDLIDKKEE